jgi:hypothetical protein
MQAYEMMLDFYGMELVDSKTGDLKRSENYLQRYNLAILTSSHNHLRLSRILNCLNVTGFRTHAVKLCNFLLAEVYEG